MTAYSHQRGHKIIYNNDWVYADNKQSIDIERPCIRCGKMPTREGYDACLGYIKGVKSACCGHGIEKEILIKEYYGFKKINTTGIS